MSKTTISTIKVQGTSIRILRGRGENESANGAAPYQPGATPQDNIQKQDKG